MPDRNDCPACGERILDEILTLSALPVHGASVFDTPDAARAVERGEQQLAICLACGLVFNRQFDESLLDYSGAHEVSQHFSVHFVRYARELAADWIREYSLAGRTGCEIGAGDASFLYLLLEGGVQRMTAIDPALHSHRIPDRFADRVRVCTEFFEPRHVTPGSSFICCRHTFEHIPNIGSFIDSVVQGMRDADTPLLLSEVPELTRILKSGAFWDLQYEHCSYFTASTLLGTYSRAGFESGVSRLTYSDQYLVADVSLDDDGARISPARQEEVMAIHKLAKEFAARVRDTLAKWDSLFESTSRRGDEVVIWGGGAKGLMFLSCLEPQSVRRVVDINEGLQGHYLGGVGLPICSPSALRREPPRYVLLMNPVYRVEVRKTLDELGLRQTELLALEV